MLANKIIAAIRSDGKVYPISDVDSSMGNFTNMINMKFKSEPGQNNSVLQQPLRTATVGAGIDFGKNLLQYARDGDVNGVNDMMLKGAPFSSDWLGQTAIHFAAANNSIEIADILLRAGINRDVKTKVDRTPLHFAAYHGHDKMVELLMTRGKSNVNAKDMLKMTPLHWAVEKRQKKVVEILLENDADPTILSKFNKTPIGIAVQTEQADLLQILQNAKQRQQSRKYDEEHERDTKNFKKETNDAVNSITDAFGVAVKPAHNAMEVDQEPMEDEEDTENVSNVEPIVKLSPNDEMESSALEILKSHGISMMHDDDPSNNLLTSALQNGRRLVLSEGGKMLLNNTRIKRESESSAALSSATNVKLKSEMNLSGSEENVDRARHNFIAKAKEQMKGKNVRVISLNDFHKLQQKNQLFGGISNKVPVKITKVQSPSSQNSLNSKKVFLNVKPQNQQQMQVQSANSSKNNDFKNLSSEFDEDVDLPANVIKVIQPDFEFEEMREIETRKPTMRIIKPPVKATVIGPRKETYPIPVTIKTVNYRRNSIMAQNATLNPAEMARELNQLKSQVSDLKAKFEASQKENTNYRQRLINLERMLIHRDEPIVENDVDNLVEEVNDEDDDNITLSDS